MLLDKSIIQMVHKDAHEKHDADIDTKMESLALVSLHIGTICFFTDVQIEKAEKLLDPGGNRPLACQCDIALELQTC
jgi:hypothetical protein